MRIYVGNLSPDVTEAELRSEFSAFGQVAEISLPTDKYSGQARGFAFIEMPVISEGQAAINGMNGKSLKNKQIVVNAARPRTDDRGGGPSGGRKGGGYGGGGGGYGGGGGGGRRGGRY